MKHPTILVLSALLLAGAALRAPAQELCVFADQTFRSALQEIAPAFTETTGFAVQLSLGRSAVLAAAKPTVKPLFAGVSPLPGRPMRNAGLSRPYSTQPLPNGPRFLMPSAPNAAS